MNGPYPEWLHILSLAFLSFSFLCAATIIIDELRVPTNRLAMQCETRLGDSRGQRLCGFLIPGKPRAGVGRARTHRHVGSARI